MARRWRTAGGLLQVTGRAVAHRRELFELLNALPRGGRLDCTAAEAADWWSKTHVLGEVQIRQSEPDRLEVLGRSAVQGLMLELLHPTGRAEYHLLDLEPGQVATVEPSASPLDEYEASPGSSWNWAAAEWRHALRRYHEDRGRSPDSSEAARVIRHNTEAVPRRGDQLMRLLAAMTGAELTDKRVMDVGCGFGALAAYIAIRGRVRSLVGTDINADHLRLAADCAERTGLHQRVRFRRGDMLDLSTLGEEPFDLAVANGVLIYLVTGRDLDRALGELHRILKPNGLLLARHANKWRREDPFTRRPLVHLVPWPLLWLKRRMTGSHDGDRRVRLVSVVELRRRLRRAGFGDVRFIGISEERRDTGIKRYFADAYAVTARRLP
jgi:SAM-dependent methyltransferase